MEETISIKLKDLYDLTGWNHANIRVIGSKDGKVLIPRYDPQKHGQYDDLEVYGLDAQMYFVSASHNRCGGGDLTGCRLVAWAHSYEYEKIRDGGKNEE